MNRHTPVPLTVAKRSVLSRVMGDLFRGYRDLLTARQRRRETLQLADLDDRLLEDIGFSRGEVRGALAEPLVRHPSLVLVRSVERWVRAPASEPRRERPTVPLVRRELRA